MYNNVAKMILKDKEKQRQIMSGYIKGPGDFEPECTIEPTDDQIVAAIHNHADKVAQNALSSFRQELKTALITLARFDDDDALRAVLSLSAKDLLFRGEI